MKYRTLVIKRKEEIPPEKLVKFLEVQEAFRRWATGSKAVAPAENPLKYFAKELKHAAKIWPTNGLKNGVWKVPLPFDAQLRLHPQCRDQSRGVLVDLSRGEIRIRKWGGTMEIRLRKSEIKWITQRLREGARLRLAYAWIGTGQTNLVTFNLALVFARETEPYQPRRLLVVDLNALHNGISWGVVDGERVIMRGTERPDLVRVEKLQKEISRLDSLCAERGEHCKMATEAKSRLWRLLRHFEDEMAKKLVRLAVQYKAAIVVDAPKDESMRKLREGRYSPGKKIYLNIGRLRRRLKLAEWYGVPYREAMLYSTICPRCESRMEELPNRKVKCQRCGFKAHRDLVPILWAQKRFQELIQPPSFSTLVLTPLA